MRLGAFLVLGFWAVSGNLLRGILGEQIGVSRHVPGSDG